MIRKLGCFFVLFLLLQNIHGQEASQPKRFDFGKMWTFEIHPKNGLKKLTISLPTTLGLTMSGNRHCVLLAGVPHHLFLQTD